MHQIPERFSKRQWDYLSKVEDCWFNVAEGGKRAGKNVLNVFAFCVLLETHKDKLHLIAGVTQGTARLNILECDGFGIYNFFHGRYRKGKYEGKDAVIIQTKVGVKVLIIAGGGKKGDEAVIKGNTYGMAYVTEANECAKEFIQEVFDRTISSSNRKIFHDLNPKNSKHWYYEQVLNFHQTQQEENNGYGFNYGHFTLVDNFSLSDEKIKEVLNTYDKESIWYKRDIKGIRCSVEGVIYDQYVNNTKNYLIDSLDGYELNFIQVGVDFGGNGSQHSFVATAFCNGMKYIIPIASKIVIAKGTTPTDLEREFIYFINSLYSKYGVAMKVRCDSAEQVLIQGLKRASEREHLPIQIMNAQKNPIVDRIRLLCHLLSTDRIKLLRQTTNTLQMAISTAVWDDTKFEDVRLDNGTSDIDTMDAFEYSIEEYRRQLLTIR